jgi:cytoskeletal protein CcmA (bactofilin family)
MSVESGVMIIGADTGLKGLVRNGRRVEIMGAFEGELNAQTVVIHPGGRCLGTLRADNADILGNVEGDVRVRHLINIRASGSVVGDVQYGRIVLEPGGELSARVRNVPPTVAGDFQIEVQRGRSVRISIADVTAYDPDDKAEDLRFAVTRIAGGSIILAGEPSQIVTTFTQADLAAGRVLFLHDGSAGAAATFDVVVSDAKGGSSGAPRTLQVAVV